MKKIIIIIVILFIVIFAILGGYFAIYKIDKDYSVIKYDEYTVDLVAGKATSDIKVKDTIITNIYIYNRILNFDLIGEKNDIYNKRVEISLINYSAVKAYNIIYFDIATIDEGVEELENGYHISINIGDDEYNNPSDLRIELK